MDAVPNGNGVAATPAAEANGGAVAAQKAAADKAAADKAAADKAAADKAAADKAAADKAAADKAAATKAAAEKAAAEKAAAEKAAAEKAAAEKAAAEKAAAEKAAAEKAAALDRERLLAAQRRQEAELARDREVVLRRMGDTYDGKVGEMQKIIDKLEARDKEIKAKLKAQMQALLVTKSQSYKVTRYQMQALLRC